MKECILDLYATFRGKIFISIRRCGLVRPCVKQQLVSTSVQRSKEGKEGVRTLAFAIFETRTWKEVRCRDTDKRRMGKFQNDSLIRK